MLRRVPVTVLLYWLYRSGATALMALLSSRVLEDFYAVGTLADELTAGFHMEAHGYLDREEVNTRLIAFARKLEQVLDKWETHAALIA